MKFIKYLILIALFAKSIADPLPPLIKQFKVADSYGVTWYLTVTAIDGKFPSSYMIIDGNSQNFGFFEGPQINEIDLGINQIAATDTTRPLNGLIGNTLIQKNVQKLNIYQGGKIIEIVTLLEVPGPAYGNVVFHIVYQ